MILPKPVGMLILITILAACEDHPVPPAGSLNDAIVMRKNDAVLAHLAAGTDVNAADASGVTPLIAATTSGQTTIVQSLLAAGANINARGSEDRTALMYAIQTSQPEMALFLLDQKGIDLEARESHGSTPLAEAMAFHQKEVAMALLARGVDINAPGPMGRTALHISATELDPQTITWLLKQGADPDARDDDGAIPLHFAALFPAPLDALGESSKVENTLDLLIKATSDLNTPTQYGQTPLHFAVLWADPWIIKKLLVADANPLAMDRAGSSPVCSVTAGDQARPRTLVEAMAIVSLFREAGITDETPIDQNGATLRTLTELLRRNLGDIHPPTAPSATSPP